MGLLFADVEVDHRHDKNDSEEDQSRSTCASLMVTERVVNKSNDRIESAGISRGTHIVTKYTYDAGILLESSDKACDDNVRTQL